MCPQPINGSIDAADNALAKGDGAVVSELRARVLVVEDLEIGQELSCMMVERLGAVADKANDGAQAVEMVEASISSGPPYALVLMDFMMPIVDGIEATRRIRALGVSPRELPIVAVTANAESSDIGRFMTAGGQAYLPKPIGLDSLKAAFKAWLPGEHATVRVKSGSGQSLRARYELRKRATLDAIDEVLAANDCADQALETLLDMIHKLAGTAGSFGDQALSLAAAKCETELLDVAPAEALDMLKRHRRHLAHAL